MSDTTKTGAEGVTWNLGDLYASESDPRLVTDLDAADRRADAFAAKYRGRVADLSAKEMVELLTEYEAIADLAGKAGSFASLSWTTQTDDPARGALLQKVTERGSHLRQRLVFLDIEWANVPDGAAARLIGDPLLARWRHWLVTARRYRPHLLTELEEKLLQEKSTTGAAAWSRFFDEVHGANRFEWEGAQVPEQVVLAKLHEPDRAVRRAAAASVTRGLHAVERTTTYIANTLLADKASDDGLRKYPGWISARNMDNQVDDATVDALVGTVIGRYDIVARYYRLKRRLLGLDELFDYDRYAPLPAAERRFSWHESREIVLAAYRRFHPRMAEIASQFFDKRWIDADVHPGKRGGAFSDGCVPSVHPWVFVNYLGRSDDVMTVAHELGHGVHQFLARDRGILLANTPLTTAETASIFGETLVFNDLFARERDAKVKLAMLVREIEGGFATVFRQVAMNRFEEAMHTARRTGGELTTADFSRLWLDTQRAMFGDSVTLTDDYGLWWSYIPHFIHTPGYVYAYSFGDLLVRALYARYRAAPDGFADRYLALLAAGGSDWPHELLAPFGVDLKDPGFWAQGLGLLEEMVNQAERLAHDAGA
ncbi:MAG: M3 family oligoendopeptidase [Spirochaetes bacterium]|nr:M3 family oligoendopeptidase [Spirochaetota bacterium]